MHSSSSRRAPALGGIVCPAQDGSLIMWWPWLVVGRMRPTTWPGRQLRTPRQRTNGKRKGAGNNRAHAEHGSFQGINMANYKYQQFLTQSQHAAFDQILHPGNTAQHSGIYRCEGCGINEVSTHNHPLPPQNHHQHNSQQGAILWRLIVATK